MNIELFRISSCDLPHHPAYVAGNLKQVSQVCDLIGTTNTVWSRAEIDIIGRRAAAGELDMHDSGARITISSKHGAPPEDQASIVVLKSDELATVLAALRFYQESGLADDPMKRSDWIHHIATDGESLISLNGEAVDELCERINCSQVQTPAVPMQTPFTGEELTTLFEFAREAMSDAEVFDNVGEKMDVADRVMAELRDKLQAVMDSDVPILGQQTVVLELIENRPSATIHPTERAALDHAVRCAMENLYSPDDPEDPAARREAEEDFCSTLTDYDRIQEGDYEVHIIIPAN